ncbi:hypothetical protein Ciccas_013594 [Cichlidogyrus casuarinus]|uniref:Vomeronasal type-1 receptor n=1 Tax=Cichlidogyrus casuarinus TaxID=1844966 RepID=A0ABD2PQ80_9PLAT
MVSKCTELLRAFSKYGFYLVSALIVVANVLLLTYGLYSLRNWRLMPMVHRTVITKGSVQIGLVLTHLLGIFAVVKGVIAKCDHGHILKYSFYMTICLWFVLSNSVSTYYSIQMKNYCVKPCHKNTVTSVYCQIDSEKNLCDMSGYFIANAIFSLLATIATMSLGYMNMNWAEMDSSRLSNVFSIEAGTSSVFKLDMSDTLNPSFSMPSDSLNYMLRTINFENLAQIYKGGHGFLVKHSILQASSKTSQESNSLAKSVIKSRYLKIHTIYPFIPNFAMDNDSTEDFFSAQYLW